VLTPRDGKEKKRKIYQMLTLGRKKRLRTREKNRGGKFSFFI